MAERPGVDKSVQVRLTPRARAVMQAFMKARSFAPGFLLSCGVLPEVSESVTERLHRVIHQLAGEQFNRGRHVRALRVAVGQIAQSPDAVDRIETQLTEVVAAETTAAYLFGLAVGLTLGALPERIRL